MPCVSSSWESLCLAGPDLRQSMFHSHLLACWNVETKTHCKNVSPDALDEEWPVRSRGSRRSDAATPRGGPHDHKIERAPSLAVCLIDSQRYAHPNQIACPSMRSIVLSLHRSISQRGEQRGKHRTYVQLLCLYRRGRGTDHRVSLETLGPKWGHEGCHTSA